MSQKIYWSSGGHLLVPFCAKPFSFTNFTAPCSASDLCQATEYVRILYLLFGPWNAAYPFIVAITDIPAFVLFGCIAHPCEEFQSACIQRLSIRIPSTTQGLKSLPLQGWILKGLKWGVLDFRPLAGYHCRPLPCYTMLPLRPKIQNSKI